MRPGKTLKFAAPSLLLAVPAQAHHSFAMFDSSKVMTLKGTVHQFRWTNPHVALFVKVDGSNDPGKLWSVELTSPGNLKRLGWTRTALKAGDPVEVEINPLRDGRRGGGFRSVTFLETGETWTARLIEVEKR